MTHLVIAQGQPDLRTTCWEHCVNAAHCQWGTPLAFSEYLRPNRYDPSYFRILRRRRSFCCFIFYLFLYTHEPICDRPHRLEIDDGRSSVKQLIKGRDCHFCDRMQHSSQDRRYWYWGFHGECAGKWFTNRIGISLSESLSARPMTCKPSSYCQHRFLLI